MSNQVPNIEVGILQSDCIEVSLHGEYQCQENIISGLWKITNVNDELQLQGEGSEIKLDINSQLMPVAFNDSHLTIHNVTIGIGFHWERQEEQSFKGGLRFQLQGDLLMAINVLPLEDYLLSVISSEMSATSSLELLKAHAVISRSWLLAQINKRNNLENQEPYKSFYQSEDEWIKWYDREDHEGFDVCADDHCQRYQGITRSTAKAVQEAIEATFGEVLSYDDEICDARFSKCCGGMVETFENVWEPVKHPYLQAFVDDDDEVEINLKQEAEAQNWILNQPKAFCNTPDKKILSQVLNDYDQETNDFYRWKVEYSQTELSALVKSRIGIDFGTIEDLIPIERGESGRLIKLKIVGDKKSLIIGKELEIRKTLSKSHLYSSAFVVKKEVRSGQLFFILNGAGWGHGVGLCQIGAAVMGAKGYDYNQILMHYFRGAQLKKMY